MTTAEPPVKVGVADGVHVLVVGAVKKLHLQHHAAAVAVLHLGFLPAFIRRSQKAHVKHLNTPKWKKKNGGRRDDATHLQLKKIPQGFVLNPLDFDDAKAAHGFTEKRFHLLVLLRGGRQGDSLEKQRGTIRRLIPPLLKTCTPLLPPLICVTGRPYLESCWRELAFVPVGRYSSKTCVSSGLPAFTTLTRRSFRVCAHKNRQHATQLWERPPQSALLNRSCRDKPGPSSHELLGAVHNVFLDHIWRGGGGGHTLS